MGNEVKTGERLAIITGGTRGLGREISLNLGQKGYCILAMYHTDDLAAEALQSEFRTKGISGNCLRVDISTADFSEFFKHENIAELCREANEIIYLHNAAAAFIPEKFHLISDEMFEVQWRTSFLSAVQAYRNILPYMVKKKRGGIVNVLTESLGDVSPKGFSAYLGAKQALLALGKSLAAEYGALGIRVYGVSPPWMSTRMTENWDDRLVSEMKKRNGPPPSPEIVAQWLVSLILSPATPGRGENYFFNTLHKEHNHGSSGSITETPTHI